MNTLTKKYGALRKNNKGFTLVELIIVIAIIAVLAVVLAPQYIKYVEKSREATDKNAVAEIAAAAQVAWVEESEKASPDNVVDISIDGSGALSYAGGTGTLDAAVSEVVAGSSYTFKSKRYRGKSIAITVDQTTGVATVGTPSVTP